MQLLILILANNTSKLIYSIYDYYIYRNEQNLKQYFVPCLFWLLFEVMF